MSENKNQGEFLFHVVVKVGHEHQFLLMWLSTRAIIIKGEFVLNILAKSS